VSSYAATNGNAALGRSRGAVHVRRIHSMPAMGESSPGTMIRDGFATAGSESIVSIEEKEEHAFENDASSLLSQSKEASSRYPRQVPRQAEASQLKASPPPSHVRRAEQSSSALAFDQIPVRSANVSLSSSAVAKPTRQDSGNIIERRHAVERASSAHVGHSGPQSHSRRDLADGSWTRLPHTLRATEGPL